MKKTALIKTLYALLITLVSAFIITLIWNIAKYGEYKISWGSGIHLSVVIGIGFFILNIRKHS